MNNQAVPDPRTNANRRFVYGPYRPLAYPYQVSYPAYTYPKINVRYGRIPVSAQAQKQNTNTSSLQSVTNNIIQKIKVPQSPSPQPAQTIDDKMLPYIFRHYRPPSYNELWDYNKTDMNEYQHSEAIRLEVAREVYDAPGSYKKVRR